MKIFIDDGHGADTPGKRSPLFTETVVGTAQTVCAGEEFRENQFNSALADKLIKLLERAGIEYHHVSPGDQDISLGERVRRVNRLCRPEDVLISIHCDAYSPVNPPAWNQANGVTTYHYTHTSVSDKVARFFHPYLLEGTQRRNRGVKGENFYLLRKTRCRAILLECGFMTNWQDCKWLLDEGYRIALATALMRGILHYRTTFHPEAATDASLIASLSGRSIC